MKLGKKILKHKPLDRFFYWFVITFVIYKIKCKKYVADNISSGKQYCQYPFLWHDSGSTNDMTYSTTF